MFCPLPLWMVRVQQMYPALSLVTHYSHFLHISCSCQVQCSSPHHVLAAGAHKLCSLTPLEAETVLSLP